jgi:hypothetical protein|nr:MAG TPA: hypothetical protein [Caudoviricetes sp.]
MGVKSYFRRHKPYAPKPQIQDETGVNEYPDALLTLHLNTIFNNNSNTALRAGINVMLERIKSPRVRFILIDIRRSPSSVGRLNFYYGELERGLTQIREYLEKSPQ